MEEIKVTNKEKEIIKTLNHPLYTVEFLEHWTKRNDNVFVNAPAALQAMGAKGYYQAVQRMALNSDDNPKKSVNLNRYSQVFGSEEDRVEVGEYVYAKVSAEEHGFLKNHLYEILDTNEFDTILVKNEAGDKIEMSVEYFSSNSTLN